MIGGDQNLRTRDLENKNDSDVIPFPALHHPSDPPQSALGLEHLSHLEQLDLGHNLISTAVSARALSFNRSLKMLWLEGNPFAANPWYRPTLTCLLPHVRAIDRKGMPPNSQLEPRSAGDGGTIASAAGRVGESINVASKEFQEEQDERRSNEWRHVFTIL